VLCAAVGRSTDTRAGSNSSGNAAVSSGDIAAPGSLELVRLCGCDTGNMANAAATAASGPTGEVHQLRMGRHAAGNALHHCSNAAGALRLCPVAALCAENEIAFGAQSSALKTAQAGWTRGRGR
jgi:hypothetical protein